MLFRTVVIIKATAIDIRKLLSMIETADSCNCKHSPDAQKVVEHSLLQLPPPAPFVRKSRGSNYSINASIPTPMILDEQFIQTATNQEQEIASNLVCGSSNYEMLLYLLDTDYPDLVPTSVAMNTEN